MGRFSARTVVAALLVSLLSACEGAEVSNPPTSVFDPEDQARRDRYGTITGNDGFNVSTRAEENAGGVGGALGVNAYLWRATLDTIDFMPLASADPFGGLIITDWYQSVDAPGERVKLHVLIKDAVLRADGIKVSMFRQVSDASGGWLDGPVDGASARALEDRILTRARELRIAQVGNTGN